MKKITRINTFKILLFSCYLACFIVRMNAVYRSDIKMEYVPTYWSSPVLLSFCLLGKFIPKYGAGQPSFRV